MVEELPKRPTDILWRASIDKNQFYSLKERGYDNILKS